MKLLFVSILILSCLEVFGQEVLLDAGALEPRFRYHLFHSNEVAEPLFQLADSGYLKIETPVYQSIQDTILYIHPERSDLDLSKYQLKIDYYYKKDRGYHFRILPLEHACSLNELKDEWVFEIYTIPEQKLAFKTLEPINAQIDPLLIPDTLFYERETLVRNGRITRQSTVPDDSIVSMESCPYNNCIHPFPKQSHYQYNSRFIALKAGSWTISKQSFCNHEPGCFFMGNRIQTVLKTLKGAGYYNENQFDTFDEEAKKALTQFVKEFGYTHHWIVDEGFPFDHLMKLRQEARTDPLYHQDDFLASNQLGLGAYQLNQVYPYDDEERTIELLDTSYLKIHPSEFKVVIDTIVRWIPASQGIDESMFVKKVGHYSIKDESTMLGIRSHHKGYHGYPLQRKFVLIKKRVRSEHRRYEYFEQIDKGRNLLVKDTLITQRKKLVKNACLTLHKQPNDSLLVRKTEGNHSVVEPCRFEEQQGFYLQILPGRWGYWKDFISLHGRDRCSSREKRISTLAEVKQALKQLGYFHGTTDSKMTLETKQALTNYQKEHGLPIGQLDIETMTHLDKSIRK